MDVALLMYKLRKGELSVAEVPFIVSTERTDNGQLLWHLSIKDNNDCKELFSIWDKKIEDKSAKRNTGGKKPYVMLMLEEMDKTDLTTEEYGAIVKLAKYVDWGTGQLIHKRSKKPISFDDIVKKLGFSEKKTKQLVKSLKNKYAISHFKKDGYFLCRTFLKKGVR